MITVSSSTSTHNSPEGQRLSLFHCNIVTSENYLAYLHQSHDERPIGVGTASEQGKAHRFDHKHRGYSEP